MFDVDASGVGTFPNAVIVLVVASHGFLCCLCVECLQIQFFLGVNGAAACRIFGHFDMFSVVGIIYSSWIRVVRKKCCSLMSSIV